MTTGEAHTDGSPPVTWTFPGKRQGSCLARSAAAPSPSASRPLTQPHVSGVVLPLVVFVSAGAVFGLIEGRRDHCPGISG